MTTATRLTHVAKALDVPPRTLRRWVSQDRLWAVKHGRTWYVDMLDAAELVQMRHANQSGRLAKPGSGRYDPLQSVDCSPNTGPASTSTQVGGAVS